MEQLYQSQTVAENKRCDESIQDLQRILNIQHINKNCGLPDNNKFKSDQIEVCIYLPKFIPKSSQVFIDTILVDSLIFYINLDLPNQTYEIEMIQKCFQFNIKPILFIDNFKLLSQTQPTKIQKFLEELQYTQEIFDPQNKIKYSIILGSLENKIAFDFVMIQNLDSFKNQLQSQNQIINNTDLQLLAQAFTKENPKFLQDILEVYGKTKNNLQQIFNQQLINQAPNPIQAQTIRYEKLLTVQGQNDENIKDLRSANKNGILLIYLSDIFFVNNENPQFQNPQKQQKQQNLEENEVQKIINTQPPENQKNQSFNLPKKLAIGRQFSGTLNKNDQIIIIIPKNPTLHNQFQQTITINEIFILNTNAQNKKLQLYQQNTSQPGNLIFIPQISHLISNNISTITSKKNNNQLLQFQNIYQKLKQQQNFSFIIEPVVPAELPNLLIAVQECLFYDKFINFKTQDTGEHVLTGLNFHHLQNFLENLEKQLENSQSQNQNSFQMKLKTSFLPKIQESLKGKSETLMAKSPNKHNRIFASSQKIQPELYNLITNEELFQDYDPNLYLNLDTEKKNLMKNYLKEHIQIEQNQDQKIFQPQFDLLPRLWSFGLSRENGNLLLDNMHGVQFKNEHKDSQIRGFNWVTQEGPLTENNITKLQTNLNDFTGMSDAIHRGGGQIIPAMRYVVISTYLSAQPTINVANFKVKLDFNIKDLQKIKDIVQKYSVTIEKENENKMLVVVNGIIYNQFYEEINLIENCQIDYSNFNQMYEIPGSIFDENSESRQFILKIRQKKGMKQQIPDPNDYISKL